MIFSNFHIGCLMFYISNVRMSLCILLSNPVLKKARAIMAEKFCLKWNDFYSHVSKSFGLFRNEDYLHDVTLVSDDHNKIEAHKLVLSASSEYFKDIFKNNHNTLILYFALKVFPQKICLILWITSTMEKFKYFEKNLIDF